MVFIYDKIYNGEFKEARIIKLLVFQIIFNLAMKYEERIHERMKYEFNEGSPKRFVKERYTLILCLLVIQRYVH